MDPKEFLKSYKDGLKLAPARPAPGAALPVLAERHYYSEHEPHRYMDNFAVENLTRPELLTLIGQLNVDNIKNPTPGQLRAAVSGRDHTIRVLGQQLAEQQQLLAAQAAQVEALHRIYGLRAYRYYRFASRYVRAIRRLLGVMRRAGKRLGLGQGSAKHPR